MTSLQTIPICVQKFHHDDDLHHDIGRHVNSGGLQKALFMKSALWSRGDAITVSFMPMDPGVAPQWYTLDSVKPITDNIEYDARKLSFPDAFQKIIKERVMPNVTSLKIQFVDSGGMIRVRFDNTGGCSSLIGKQCLQAPEDQYTLTLGWMDVGTIIHEFSHALGMLHEHQNPDGNKIQWNRDAVYSWAAATQGWDKETTDINILNDYPLNEITGSVFDPKSVMLYFFSADLTLNGVGTSMNHTYSDTDKSWLQSLYSNAASSPPAPPSSDSSSSGPVSHHARKSPPAKSGGCCWPIVVVVAALIVLLLILMFT
jgi:hypothetical protein